MAGVVLQRVAGVVLGLVQRMQGSKVIVIFCAYCRERRAIHKDHVVPRALRRRHKGFDDLTVPACGECNWRKGTRRLAPVGFDLTLLPGKGWRCWDGSVEALREVMR